MIYHYNRKAYNNKVKSLAKLDLKIFKTIIKIYYGYVYKDTVVRESAEQGSLGFRCEYTEQVRRGRD